MPTKGTELNAKQIAAHEQGTDSNSVYKVRRMQLRFAGLFLLVACSGAAYLSAVSILGGGLAGCGPESGCNKVLSSRWAYWLHVPVSVPAFAVYITLLVLTLRLGMRPDVGSQTRKWKATICLSLVVLGAACWFLLLQIFVVKAWCKFCLATHLTGVVAACVLMSRSLSGAVEQTSSTARQTRRDWATSGAYAALVLAVLIVGQVAVKKRLYGVSLLSGFSRSGLAEVALHAGRFRLYPKELPGWGVTATTNANYIISLFDYTCSHCRALHPFLKEVPRSYPGRLAVVALPVPLDASCNPLILVTAPPNQNACDYARLSLAVWHARHEMFTIFDDWLFASDRPPPIEQARLKAQELIGKEILAAELDSEWVRQQLKLNVSLYQANSKAVRDAHLPQLNIGTVIAHGAIDTQEDLFHLIERGFEKKAPE